MELLFLALLFSPVFVIIAVNRNRRRRSRVFAATVEISVDAEGARRVLADGRREEVRWDEVSEVDVFTTRKGPHKEAGGAVVLYGDAERGCVIPLDVVDSSGLLLHITRLEGLRLQTVLDAINVDQRREMAVAQNPVGGFIPRPWQTTTVCWTRDSGAPPPPDAGPADDARP